MSDLLKNATLFQESRFLEKLEVKLTSDSPGRTALGAGRSER